MPSVSLAHGMSLECTLEYEYLTRTQVSLAYEISLECTNTNARTQVHIHAKTKGDIRKRFGGHYARIQSMIGLKFVHVDDWKDYHTYKEITCRILKFEIDACGWYVVFEREV